MNEHPKTPAANAERQIQAALSMLEQTFLRFNIGKAAESNRHPVGDPNRVEYDLTELEKAHLRLLESTLNATIARAQLEAAHASSKSSEKLGKKVFWLNIVLAALSAVVATAAILELFQ